MLRTSQSRTIHPILVGLLFASSLTISSGARAQNVSALLQLFGGIVQGQIADTARREWQNRPVAEYDCLEQHRVSVDDLAARGIAPSDPRIRRIISECGSQKAQEVRKVVAAPTGYNPRFVVDGLALGAFVSQASAVYQAYACQPSEQFAGYTWCRRHRDEQGKFGPQSIANSILHSASGASLYISKMLSPAFFSAGDIDREIDRLSRQFGLHAQIQRAEGQSGYPKGIVVTWGDVTLTPLDSAAVEDLKNNQPIRRGFLFDFLGNERRSAREGMPVFQITGGAGYIWGANFDENGKGLLRLTTIDPSALGITAPSSNYANAPAAVPALSAPSNVSSFVAPTAPTPDPIQQAEADANSARQKAQRLEKLLPTARELVDDASSVVKSDPKNPKLLDFVERIGALNNAISQNEPDEIEKKSFALITELGREPVYKKIEEARNAERQRATAQFLGDTIKTLQRQKTFMLAFISTNPTSPSAAKFIPYIKQIDPLLIAPTLNSAQPVAEKIDFAIREAGLRDAYAAMANNPTPPTNSETSGASEAKQLIAAGSQPVNTQIPTTDKNRFLLEGDLDDIVLLYNASASAPQIARNLRGEFVFKDDRADICLFGKNPDEWTLFIESKISTLHARTIVGMNQSCDVNRLNAFDIIATQRGTFLRQTLPDALALTKSIENDEFKKLNVIAGDELKNSTAAERQKVEDIAHDIASATRQGFGVLLLKTGSPNICVVAPDRIEAHSQILLRAADKLAFDMRTSPTLTKSSAEGAFVDVQKAQCGAVYAAAADLKGLSEAMIRENIPFAFSSTWIVPAEIETADKEAIAQKAGLEAQATQRARKASDEQKLQLQRQNDHDSTLPAQEAALRAKYGAKATAAAAQIGDEIKQWTDGQQGSVGVAYPAYAAWLSAKVADHWDIMQINSQLEDFGTSDYKGRTLDTPFVKVTIKLKNRMLGEYQDACFIAGRIHDVEFALNRESTIFTCDRLAELNRWKMGHQFHSLLYAE